MKMLVINNTQELILSLLLIVLIQNAAGCSGNVVHMLTMTRQNSYESLQQKRHMQMAKV